MLLSGFSFWHFGRVSWCVVHLRITCHDADGTVLSSPLLYAGGQKHVCQLVTLREVFLESLIRKTQLWSQFMSTKLRITKRLPRSMAQLRAHAGRLALISAVQRHFPSLPVRWGSESSGSERLTMRAAMHRRVAMRPDRPFSHPRTLKPGHLLLSLL